MIQLILLGLLAGGALIGALFLALGLALLIARPKAFIKYLRSEINFKLNQYKLRNK
tara:strand:+ start:110 stop:277 length:168 start_codon:yes stop_codon:yes gene_type:complete